MTDPTKEQLERMLEEHRNDPTPQCDFCSAPRPHGTFLRYYDCPDMVGLALKVDTGEVQELLNSRRGFCACVDCEKLIDAEEWQQLEDRCVEQLTLKLGYSVDRAPVRGLQTAFRRNFKR